jgi:hypothetical protein
MGNVAGELWVGWWRAGPGAPWRVVCSAPTARRCCELLLGLAGTVGESCVLFRGAYPSDRPTSTAASRPKKPRPRRQGSPRVCKGPPAGA